MSLSRLEAHPRISVSSVSEIYESEPLYNRYQPYFLNRVVRISTDLSPHDLLSVCQQIEREMGRKPSPKENEPRIIDIDLIFYGNRIIENENLQVPHKQYSKRRFVLVPLNEIAPNFVCPDSGVTVGDTFRSCPDRSRVEPYVKVESI